MGGHRNIEYAFWANEQAFGSAILLFIGGLIGIIPYTGFTGQQAYFGYYWAAALSIAVSVVVMVIEYPRGKRKKGTNVPRRLQHYPAKVVTILGPVTRNYYSRASVPCCCLITTLLGGLGLVFSSIIYLVSAIKGEQWIAPSAPVPKTNTGGAKYVPEAPKNPPPRRPQAKGYVNNGATAGD